MPQDHGQPGEGHPYHHLHHTPEELAHLPPDELLQAALEARNLLQIVMGILSASDKDLIVRAVAADLVYTQAMHASQDPAGDESAPATYDIKAVSLRLGLSPTQVRHAFEQLNTLGGIHILARQFPPRKRNQQLHLPLDESTAGRQQ